jgi:hypothetical protein
MKADSPKKQNADLLAVMLRELNTHFHPDFYTVGQICVRTCATYMPGATSDSLLRIADWACWPHRSRIKLRKRSLRTDRELLGSLAWV